MFSRAIRDTFKDIPRSLFVGGVGFALTFLGYVYVLGWDAALGEFRTWLIGVVGSGAGLALLFLWNLSRASYRIEREAHQATRAERVKALEESGLPVDWSVWESEGRFTLLEAAATTSARIAYDTDVKRRLLTDLSDLHVIANNPPMPLTEEQALRENTLSLNAEQAFAQLADDQPLVELCREYHQYLRGVALLKRQHIDHREFSHRMHELQPEVVRRLKM